jgi:hypothetical protein
MKSLQQIGALYDEIDRGFDAEFRDALNTGNTDAAQRIEQKQLLNDQAYFVLCWGQLETEIDDACRAAIRKRKASTSWEKRRGFDFYNPDDKRLSGLTFDRRVPIVLDLDGGPGSPYAKVMSYYEMRNKVAHGKLEAKRIDVSAVVADFFVIQSALAR